MNTSSYYCECDRYYYGRNCEQKINICENETCSNHGICKDINHEAKCECFKSYSGDKCEIESDEKKTIEKVVSTATIIAIITIISLFLLVLAVDILNCVLFKRKKNSSNKKKIVIYRLKYHN
jgi:lipopolysaccharide/colanic/teichoic acid biosynthesis glycosyltransferase